MNQNKYRQIQTALEETEERADEAENSLMRAKSKIRTNSSGRLLNNGGLMHSATINGMRNGINTTVPIVSNLNARVTKTYSTADNTINYKSSEIPYINRRTTTNLNQLSVSTHNFSTNKFVVPHSPSYSNINHRTN